MKIRKRLKSILSGFLVTALLICSVPMTTVTAIASTTNNIPDYLTFQAEKYSSEEVGFDNIFVGTDSSSFARTYFNDMKNDDKFVVAVNAWEAIHIATSPSYSLESGLINKKDFYETILFDMLDVSDNGSLASEFGSTYSKLFKAIKNQNNSFVISTANKIMGKDDISADELKSLKYDDLSEDAKKLLLNGSKYAEVSSVVSDVNKLLGYAKSAYEAIEKVSDYLSIKEYQDGTKEILDYIVSDTRNDAQLRLAADTVSKCFDKAFNSVLIAISEGTLFGLETCLGEVMDGAWGEIVATIPGGPAVLLAAKGSRLLCNYLFSTDKEIEGYYLLEASVNMEDAFIRAIASAQEDMKEKSVETAVVYMQGISMYKNVVLLGFDYSIDLLETAANSKFNTSTDFWLGNYSECISLINDVESFKTQKINNYVAYEDMIFNAYKQKYFSNYDEVESSLDKAKVLISSMEVKQIKNINIGDSGFIYDFFSFKYYPENHTELSVEDGVTSSDESVIKVTKNSWICDSITAVGEGTCTLTFTSNLGKFTDSIEVTVGSDISETETKNDWDIGLMYDNNKNIVAYIRAYNGNDTNVVVPDKYEGYSVGAINNAIFQDNTRIKRVIIPEAIYHISASCFKGCSSLEYVSLPSKLTSISSYMFYGCESLTSITIPDNVVYIEDNAFAECTNLKEVNLPDSISSIGEKAFYNCKSIKSNIVFTNNIQTISRQAFYGCEKIKEVIIPANLKEIEDGTFFKCNSLTIILLPDGLGTIGKGAFSECVNLTNIIIPNSVTDIHSGAFYNCSKLSKIVIPNGVTSIRPLTFANCVNLSEVVISDSVTWIENNAFKNCSGIKNLTIPCSADFAASWFNPYGSVSSSEYWSDERITDSAFTGDVKMEIDTLTITAGNGVMPEFEERSYNDGITWIGDLPWSSKHSSVREIVLQNGVQNISEYAFKNTDVEKITMADTILSIGKEAFLNCKKLKEVELPDKLATIEEYAFSNCSNLETVKISNSLVKSNNYAFKGCDSLKRIDYNGTLSQWCSIDFGSRYGGNPTEYAHCLYINGEELKGDLIIPDGVTIINNNTFSGCRAITSVKIPEGVTEIRYGAFDDCVGLKYVVLPDSLKSIGNYAFEYCNFLYINIGNNLNLIETLSFTEKVNHVFYRGSETEWNEMSGNVYLLSYAEKIHYNATIEDKLDYCNTIETSCLESGYDLYKCTCCSDELCTNYVEKLDHNYVNGICTICHDGLAEDLGFDFENGYIRGYNGNATEIIIPKTINGIKVTSIGSAFRGNETITSISIPDGVTYIQSGAFKDCTSLESIVLPKSIKEIQQEAFAGCTNLSSVVISEDANLEYVSGDAFSDTLFMKEKAHYSNGFLILGNYLLKADENISGICIIPDGITVIGERAFENYDWFYKVVIPEGVTKIESKAFLGCKRLAIIHLPKTIQTVGRDNFPSRSPNDTWSLRTLYVTYSGTEQEWYNINFDEWNELQSAIKHFNSMEDTLFITEIREHTQNSGGGLTFHCSEHDEDISIDFNFISHKSNETIFFSPTCTEKGYIYNRCICGYEYKTDYTNALGHDISDGVCKNCGLDEDCCIESEHDYAIGCDETWTIYRPEAKRIVITFNTDTYTNYSSDYISIYDAADKMIAEYSGGGLAGKRIVIKGNTVKIRLRASYKWSGAYGFALSNVEIYYEDCQHIHTENIDAREATCGTAGSTGYVRCLDCNEIIAGPTIIPATGLHEMTEMVTVIKPSCTNSGYDVYHCGVCGKDYYTNYTSPLGHTPVVKNIIEPTCFENGHTEYYCSVCDYEWNDIIAPTGHAFNNGVCISCGMLEEDCIESEHNYENNSDLTWKIHKPHAKSITITFSSNTYTELNYDFIYIYDANDKLIGKGSGSGLASQSITVIGDTITIRLTSDGSANGYGFSITNVVAVYPSIIEGVIIDGKIDDSETKLCVDKLAFSDINIPDEGNYDFQSAVIYDIYIEKAGERVQPTNSMTISIPVPETMDGSKCKVIHIDDSGNITDMNAVYENGYMIFTTDHFSYYVLVGNLSDNYIVKGNINSYGNPEDKITLKLLQGTIEIDSIETTDNLYSFDGISAGTYTLEVSKPNHATRTYEITVGNEDVTQDIEVYLIGDVNGDGKVNTIDVNRVYAHVRETNLLAGYELKCANVAGTDSTVNTVDVNRIYAHVKGTNLLW